MPSPKNFNVLAACSAVGTSSEPLLVLALALGLSLIKLAMLEHSSMLCPVSSLLQDFSRNIQLAPQL